MRFPGNLFRRKRPPDAEDWHVGDIAECVNSQGWFPLGIVSTPDPAPGPAFGDTYRVAEVEEVQGTRVGPLVALGFSAFDDLYRATEFRKVRPRADKQVAGTATSIADLRPAPAKESEVA